MAIALRIGILRSAQALSTRSHRRLFRPPSATALPEGRERRRTIREVRWGVCLLLLRALTRLLFEGGSSREVAGARNCFRADALQLYWNWGWGGCAHFIDWEPRRLFFLLASHEQRIKPPCKLLLLRNQEISHRLRAFSISLRRRDFICQFLCFPVDLFFSQIRPSGLFTAPDFATKIPTPSEDTGRVQPCSRNQFFNLQL